ncbi:peptidylprolyl isomerase [Candidatus Igneacidithiobacillus taiwanensis]|uniref:peptidylprolyl isomerase n=1 Tax=Candidatus Igneacidithiobacillus taiwanensis TaxID=1945924 RepID=UPI00289E61BD|nr:peptidylprolyl isomerase [Candidatus Igneacidithiobacillus taiwanensis]MCE5359929.1 peptidylprolyl isomerase [Acidithiobacillus sp.]
MFRLRHTLTLALLASSCAAYAATPFVNRDTLLAAPASNSSRVFSARSEVAPESSSSLPANLDYLDKVVAVVNDQIITSLQLDQRVATIKAQLQQQAPGQLPPDSVLRRQVLQQMILQDIEVQMAKRMDISVDQATLDQAVANIARSNNLTPDQLRQALSEQGLSWSSFEDNLRDRILVDRLQQQEVEARVHLSDDEVRTFATQLKQLAGVSFELQQIFLPLPADPSPDALSAVRQDAARVHEELVNGASFTRLATEVSAAHDALQGGRLGWVKAAELPSSVSQALLKLKPGDISSVISTPTGYRIFKLLDIKHEDPSVTEVKAAMIVLHAGKGIQEQEAEAQAKDIESSLQAGASFAELAKRYSQDSRTAAQGGDLGWVAPGQLPDELERVLATLPTGNVSAPIPLNGSIYILQSLGQRQTPLSDAQLNSVARMQLFQRTAQERLEEWQRRIRDSAYVEILDPSLRTQNA